MRHRRVTLAILICVLLATTQARAESTEVPVEGGTLLLDVPKDWKGTIEKSDFGPTLQLVPSGKGDFKVLFTAVVSKGKLPDDAAVERQVRKAGESQLPGAVQTAIEPQPVKGAEARGYVYHLTDKDEATGPGEYKELYQGAVVVAPLLVSVTILTHAGDADVAKAALSAIAGARYRAAPK